MTLKQDFWTRWRHRQIYFASLQNQKKDKNNKFKTKIQLELPENLTIWMSNNQGVNEQTVRLVGEVEMGSWGGEDMWQGGSWRTRQFHICMQINQEEHWVVRQTSQPRVPAQGSKTLNHLTGKTCGFMYVHSHLGINT